MVDLFGKPSSDYDGTLSLSGYPRSPCNSLLISEEFLALPDTTIPRDSCVPGYRNRVLLSAIDVSPWSARSVSLISVSELEIGCSTVTSRSFKGYVFPVQQSKLRTLPKSSWSSQLMTPTKINQFYDQQPWDVYDRTVRPISFKFFGWFEKLVDVYHGFVDCHHQSLWEASNFLWISPAQRKSDPDLAAFA